MLDELAPDHSGSACDEDMHGCLTLLLFNRAKPGEHLLFDQHQGCETARRKGSNLHV
jgi:hypothetical protein